MMVSAGAGRGGWGAGNEMGGGGGGGGPTCNTSRGPETASSLASLATLHTRV